MRVSRQAEPIECVAVAKVADVPPGTLVAVRAGERWYALANVDGVLYAVDNNCPHNGGPLSKGTLLGRELQCPWASWRGTGGRVSRLPVRVVGDGEIQLPDLG